MRHALLHSLIAMILCSVTSLSTANEAPAAAAPSPQQRAAMLKQWLQASQAQMRGYEWIETTVISLKGEEKSRLQKRCYYGADGVLQKVEEGATPASSGGGGPLRKRMAEKKKEELSAYMKEAVALVHSYVPPQAQDIQAAISAGRMGMQLLEPNRRVRLNFSDFKKAGDQLGVDIEIPTNRLLGISVNSHLDTTSDPVVLQVTMSVLPDGTIYAQRTVLDAAAEKLSVAIENSGYRRLGQ